MPQGRHNALIATVAVRALAHGPSCLSLATAAVGHSGSSPKAGYTSQQPAAANAEVVALLEQSRGYDWAAATSGSRTAASYQLASGQAMPIGGYTRKDPSPTLQSSRRGWPRDASTGTSKTGRDWALGGHAL